MSSRLRLQRAGGPQLRVGLLERARAELSKHRQRLVAERGQDQLVDQQGVAGPGARLDLVACEPLVAAEPVRISGLPVAGSMPPKIRTPNRAPR
jgi:hypothetical protein